MMSPTQVAARLGISTPTVYRHIKSGDLPASKVGGQLRIAEGDIGTWLVSTGTAKRVAA
jgi:excisionase family DNA binding protein